VFTDLLGHGAGVHRRPNFTAGGAGSGLERIPRDLVEVEPLERLPFAGAVGPGRVFHTLLIEPPVFLRWVTAECRRLAVGFERREIAGRDEVMALEEPVVVNAAGLGAGRLTGDSRLYAARGQLVHVEPQDLPYLLSHRGGYLFPRSDALVLGGTFERGVRDPDPDAQACRSILRRHRRFFGTAS